MIIEGSLKDEKFIAYYCKNNKVTAAAVLGVGQAAMILNEALKQGILPTAQQLKEK